ncbi:MAG: hypothetical protein LBE37_20220 [Sphingobacterium sp.]|jgi:hypothetical protein|nr:hypothetical protein [Sphingobacterium sp.]
MKTRWLNRYTALLCFLFFLIQGCYKDKGNYSYEQLPGAITITFPNVTYSKVLNQDSLIIEPAVLYDGDERDLEYEWQFCVFEKERTSFVTFQKGKKLAYKVSDKGVFNKKGSYILRLAVVNKKLKADEVNTTNQIYSQTISLEVVNALYNGLLVLHDNGVTSDLGLIQDRNFISSIGTDRVFSHLFSASNSGERIQGRGKSLGIKDDAVYVFTDKNAVHVDYLELKKTSLNYTSMLVDPSVGIGNPEYYNNKLLIDGGVAFYGAMVGPMYGIDDLNNYYLAPHAVGIETWGRGPTTSSIGFVGFDKLSASFVHSFYNTDLTELYKIPNNSNGSVAFNPANTNSNLLHFQLRSENNEAMAIAVLEDRNTLEKYLVELNFYQKDLSKITNGRYTLDGFLDINQAKFYLTGSGSLLNYYVTDRKVYRYTYQVNSSQVAYEVPATETITMAKLLKSASENKLCLATKDETGKGKLYLFSVDLTNGSLTLKRVFEGSESSGSRFGEITDVIIKNR